MRGVDFCLANQPLRRTVGIMEALKFSRKTHLRSLERGRMALKNEPSTMRVSTCDNFIGSRSENPTILKVADTCLRVGGFATQQAQCRIIRVLLDADAQRAHFT